MRSRSKTVHVASSTIRTHTDPAIGAVPIDSAEGLRGRTDMSWSSNHDASLERLQQVQGGLTVDLIIVSRDDFATCTTDETAASVKSRNAKSFSYFPVVEASRTVIGLYHAERWFDADAPDDPIGEDYTRLTSSMS